MKIFAAIFLAFIANANGVCDDDLVPLEAGQFPAVWNVGTIPHVFVNSAHLRGVGSIRDWTISGMDTVRTSVHFCPADMTIYGNLTARRIQVTGNYTSYFDYINQGSEVFGHGDGFINMTFTNVQFNNLVAPIRYSTATKRLEIEDMKYDVREEAVNPLVSGLEVDGDGAHKMNGDEFKRLDQTNSFPLLIELFRGIVNTKAQRGILVAAVKEMFAGAFSS